jgi:2-polyprenyl-3-methyl-5-hydroxy-6-metoxy-1,4-benzoquinol methylase
MLARQSRLKSPYLSEKFAELCMPLESRYEADEIRRSALDAAERTDSLVAKPALFARYNAPPRNTPFQLEYSYHLLGDIQNKTVLDYGCGAGENSLLLAARGARVTGIDISPQLIEIAKRRLELNGFSAQFHVTSGYDTGLPDNSVDVIFCMAILHHMDLALARREILRLLKADGFLIVREPVRDSWIYGFLRGCIPYSEHRNSEFERPLKKKELDAFAEGLQCEAKRRFKLPFVPLVRIASRRLVMPAIRIDAWVLRNIPAMEHLATVEVRKLRRA